MANSSSKSPELLAKYCDSLLKKSSKNPEEAELEDTLNQVVCIVAKSWRENNFFWNIQDTILVSQSSWNKSVHRGDTTVVSE